MVVTCAQEVVGKRGPPVLTYRLQPECAPPCARMTPEPPLSSSGGDRGAPVLHVDEGVLLHPDHARVERQRRPASHELGTSGERGVESLLGAIVERQHVVL